MAFRLSTDFSFLSTMSDAVQPTAPATALDPASATEPARTSPEAHSAAVTHSRFRRSEQRSSNVAKAWSGIVCGTPEDGTLLIVDWLVLIAKQRGLVIEATTLGDGVELPFGMFLDAAEPSHCDEQLVDLPREGEASFAIVGEQMELARLVAAGYLDPERTVVVASTQRAFSSGELLAPPELIVDEREIIASARASCARLISFDGARVTQWKKLPAGIQPSMMFGVMCAANILDLRVEECSAAISELNIDTDLHREGFELGLRLGATDHDASIARHESASQFVRRSRHDVERSDLPRFRAIIDDLEQQFEPATHVAIRSGVHALTVYESAEYAAELVRACTRVRDAGGSAPLIELVAHGYVAIALHPDVPYQAQVRGGRKRLTELRRRHGIERGEPFDLRDHIHVDALEHGQLSAAAGLMQRLGQRRKRSAEAPPSAQGLGSGASRSMIVESTTLGGQAQLRRLARLRAFRHKTAYFTRAVETAHVYVDVVCEALAIDPHVAALVARTGAMVHGYGTTRSSTIITVRSLWDRVVRPSLAVDRRLGYAATSPLVVSHACSELVRCGPLAVWDLGSYLLGIIFDAEQSGDYRQAVAQVQRMCA